MNKDLLKKHIKHFISESQNNPVKFNEDFKERLDLIAYYKSFTR